MENLQDCAWQELSQDEMCDVNGGIFIPVAVWYGIGAIVTIVSGVGTGYLLAKYL